MKKKYKPLETIEFFELVEIKFETFAYSDVIEQVTVTFRGRVLGRKDLRRRYERWLDESESCEELRRVAFVYEGDDNSATTAMVAEKNNTKKRKGVFLEKN